MSGNTKYDSNALQNNQSNNNSAFGAYSALNNTSLTLQLEQMLY